MLRASRAETIAIGHGRHTASAGAADALAAAWTAGAGQVLAVVDWAAAAASWLRPAQRLAGSQPDAWIMADTPAGCAQLASRLTGQPGWTPGRTFGFASVATPDLLALTPPGALAGMTGATAAGGSWRIGQSLLLVNDQHGEVVRVRFGHDEPVEVGGTSQQLAIAGTQVQRPVDIEEAPRGMHRLAGRAARLGGREVP